MPVFYEVTGPVKLPDNKGNQYQYIGGVGPIIREENTWGDCELTAHLDIDVSAVTSIIEDNFVRGGSYVNIVQDHTGDIIVKHPPDNNASFIRKGVFLFSVNITEPIATATLRLYLNAGANSVNCTVRQLLDVSWVEESITYGDVESMSKSSIFDTQSVDQVGFVDFNVSQLTLDNGKVAFLLETDQNTKSDSIFSFNSKEQANPPELIIVTSTTKYEAEVLKDDPYLYWKLDESSGTTAIDYSNNNNDGTIVNSPILDSEKPFDSSGGSIHLNEGTTNNEYVRSAALTDFPSTAVTIEMWVKPDSFSSPSQFTLVNYGPFNDIILIKLDSDPDAWRFFRGSDYHLSNSSNAFAVGEWRHIVLQWRSSDGQMRLFSNGQLISSRSSSTTSPLSQSGYFLVGQEQDGTLSGFDSRQIVRGRVAHVAVYDDYLSDQRIQAHYDAAVPNDILGTLFFLTL